MEGDWFGMQTVVLRDDSNFSALRLLNVCRGLGSKILIKGKLLFPNANVNNNSFTSSFVVLVFQLNLI